MAITSDLFLSYKSEDLSLAQEFKRALQARGVVVWHDHDTMPAGDLVPEALSKGVDSCLSVAVLVTRRSMGSEWVTHEYRRALSMTHSQRARVIPCLVDDVRLPADLAKVGYVDFRDPQHFERSMDKVVFPTLADCPIDVECFANDAYSEDWTRLTGAFDRVLGIPYIAGLSSSRLASWNMAHAAGNKVMVNLPHFGPAVRAVVLDMDFHGVEDSRDYILAHRGSDDADLRDVVFVFYHSPGYFAVSRPGLTEDLRVRFSHYFTIDKCADFQLDTCVRATWNNVLQDLWRNRRNRLLSTTP